MQLSLIQSAVKQKFDVSPCGLSSVFISIDDQWGIKLYRSEIDRDDCYNRQKLCEEFGYAPITGDKIDLPKTAMPFGYITEKVQVAVEMVEGKENLSEMYQWMRENRCEIDNATEELFDATGWDFVDNHGYNWGYKNNKLIPIDFGDEV